MVSVLVMLMGTWVRSSGGHVVGGGRVCKYGQKAEREPINPIEYSGPIAEQFCLLTRETYVHEHVSCVPAVI